MYTYESKLFSEEFKEKTILAIKRARAFLVPEDFIEQCSNVSEAESIAEWGHRWRDDEDCYHATIMFLSSMLRDSRGPGFMVEEEARQIETSLSQKGSYQDLNIDQIAKNGVLDAISCDHWYRFEKQWD